jgi:pilus assembly protein CpaF
MSGLDLPARSIREQIASALDLVVHLTRMHDGSRRVSEIAEVTDMDGESMSLRSLFAFQSHSPGGGPVSARSGRSIGALRPTGVPLGIIDDVTQADIEFVDELALAFPEHGTGGYPPPEQRWS